MDFLLNNWVLVLAALTSGFLLLAPGLGIGRGGTAAIGTNEAVRLINREKAVMIDVCDATEFAAGHAVGSRNVPLATLDSNKALPTNKTLPLIVMCATGARASRAVATLNKLGYEKVQSLSGGLNAWREANLPVEKS